MPRVVLRVSATLKNVVLLKPQPCSDDQHMNYFFKLNCEQCGWVSEEEVCVNMAVHGKRPRGSRRNSHVNLSTTCDGCERRGTISLVPGHGRPLREHGSTNVPLMVFHCDGIFPVEFPGHGRPMREHGSTNVPLMVFDCDGIFPVEYSFNGGWSAITASGKSIQVNLLGGDYNAVIDGEHIGINMAEAKFEPYND